jgi:hypothetical protein
LIGLIGSSARAMVVVNVVLARAIERMIGLIFICITLLLRWLVNLVNDEQPYGHPQNSG